MQKSKKKHTLQNSGHNPYQVYGSGPVGKKKLDSLLKLNNSNEQISKKCSGLPHCMTPYCYYCKGTEALGKKLIQLAS